MAMGVENFEGETWTQVESIPRQDNLALGGFMNKETLKIIEDLALSCTMCGGKKPRTFSEINHMKMLIEFGKFLINKLEHQPPNKAVAPEQARLFPKYCSRCGNVIGVCPCR